MNETSSGNQQRIGLVYHPYIQLDAFRYMDVRRQIPRSQMKRKHGLKPVKNQPHLVMMSKRGPLQNLRLISIRMLKLRDLYDCRRATRVL